MTRKLVAAAKRGNPDAQCQLAAILATGHGVKQDLDGALGWYRKAARQRHPEATYNLALMHLNGEATKKNTTKALRLLRTAATLGSADADELLGDSLLNGWLGSQRDAKEAALHYVRALARGSARAAFLLAVAVDEKHLDAKTLSSALRKFAAASGVREARR